jgi:hypothetical protein
LGGDADVSGNMKKVLTWLVIGFVGFYLITNPDSAAAGIRGIGSFLANLFDSVIQFLTSVFG